MQILVDIIALVGFLGLIIVLGMMAVAKFRKRKIPRNYWLGLASCFALMLFAGYISPDKAVKQETQQNQQTKQVERSADKQSAPTQEKNDSIKITDFKFANDVEKLLAQQYNVQPEKINLSTKDYWENPEGDDGLINTKGTYKAPDGKKHEFSARFVIETHEPVRLTIDDKRVFWNEELQDATMDAHSKVKNNN